MPVARSFLRIGELARATALSPDSLRHYERLGLLTATRTPGRFREYRGDAIHRVRVIQAALAIGFTLTELAEIFAERRAGRPPCRRVRALAGGKLVALTAEIRDLSRLRRRLVRTLAGWDRRLAGGDDRAPAGLLDALATASAPARRARSALRRRA
jgi:DNA-binding transcriptional MerR regulator